MTHSKQEALVQRARLVMTQNYKPAPTVFTRGEGIYLFDMAGRRYLDFAAGIAVCGLGHAHPELTRAIAEQAAQLLHVSNLYYHEPAILLAEKLTTLCFADRVYFANSGAEANEAAMKLARRYMQLVRNEPQRTNIIAAEKSFHGRTWAAITATGQPKYHKGFAPLVPGFMHVPYNDLDAMAAAIGPETCAVLVEPIQGEGGIVVPSPDYLPGLRRLCDAEGVLLIFDEVQTGIARTGRWFAHQHEGVAPDIMTLAKGLGGGVPIGAMLANEEASKGFEPGAHASTYGGNPLVCRAALTVLEVIERDGLVAHVATLGDELGAQLQSLVTRFTAVREVRGRGLMRGVGVDAEALDRAAVMGACREQGLLMTNAGSDAIRLVPPLIAGPAHVEEAVEILGSVIGDILQ